MSLAGASAFEEIGREAFQSLLREACSETLPAWLETRRWFADKGRGIAAVGIEDALIERVGPDWLALAIARVAFEDGSGARYLLPLALTQAPEDADRVIAAPGSNAGVVVDATETPWFGGWLLDQFASSPAAAPQAWVFRAPSASAALFAAAWETPATVLRAEQSNSSLRFGDELLIKLFRRLQPGPNPDEEILSALAATGPSLVPRYAGAASWRSADGETIAVALALAYVPNAGDGWSWMLHRLADVTAGRGDPGADQCTAERLLGRRTGELHVALAAVPATGFAPEATRPATLAADARRTRAAIEEAIGLLQVGQEHLPAEMRTKMPEAIAGLWGLAARADGYQDEISTHRIRVHGDYHLGQTLRTPDGDWRIIDFEGEPARPIEERRQKASALKDVAGMLRSFAYARGVAQRMGSAAEDDMAKSRLSAWETKARRAFLEGYRQALDTNSVSLVPDNDEAFHRALAAWELDKALYDVRYEARNRPDWLDLPVLALLPDLLDQPADAAGAAPA